MNLDNLIKKKNQKGTLYYEDTKGCVVAKECTDCGFVLDVSNFSKSKGSFLNLRSYCRECKIVRTKKYRTENPDVEREYRKNNRDKINLREAKRRNTKRELTNDFREIHKIFILSVFNGGCALTGSNDFTWDHVIPLATGCGGTTYKNMIPLRSDLNFSKNESNIFEWFEANRQRFELSGSKFDILISWIASANAMTVAEYKAYVYNCHQ